MTQILGIIPARGGSKGIPKKNIKNLVGKPLINYTIDAVLESTLISSFVVSTDSDEIIQTLNNHYGHTVRTLKRPNELASDTANIVTTIEHTLAQMKIAGKSFDIITLLQPTSPFRQAFDIDSALKKLIASDADGLISVLKVEDSHPHRMYTQCNGELQAYANQGEGNIRQALPDVYLRNGAIYACRTASFQKHSSLMQGKILAYEMPAEQSINIDGELDWILAEAILLNNSATQKTGTR